MWRCSFCTLFNDDGDLQCAACGFEREDQYPIQHQVSSHDWGAGAGMGPCPMCILQGALLSCMLHNPYMHGFYGKPGRMLPGPGGGMDPLSGFMTPLHYEAMNRAPNRQQFSMAAPINPTNRPMSALKDSSRIPAEDAATCNGNAEAEAETMPQPARVTPRRRKTSSRTVETARTSTHVAEQGTQPRANSKSERRIVLLGKTGSGKSATGNSILGYKAFLSKSFGLSVTKTCNRGTADKFGRRLQVIDTPGLFDTRMSNAEVSRELVKCIGMAAPGPHVFVLVLRMDRFTKEEQDSVNHFKKLFGDGMLNHTLVVFTRKDDLIHNQTSFQRFLNDAPMELKTFLELCDNRCFAFDNRNPSDKDVKAFLEIIDSILIQNGGSWYSNEMFVEAEKAVLQRENEIRQQFHDGTRDTLAKLKRNFDEQMQQLKEKCSREISRLEELRRKQCSPSPAMSTQAGIRELEEQLLELRACQDEDKRRLQAEYTAKEEKYQEIIANANRDYREIVRREIQTENKLTMRKFGKMILKFVSVLIPVIAGALGVL